MRVANAVKVTDKARFPFAIKAITLEATPLGEDPISTIPAAISAGNPNERARLIPRIGIMVN
jgi:hypothetical protein